MQLQKLIILSLLFVAPLLGACQSKTPESGNSPVQNSPVALEKPYLILISLDGFRWDYVERFQPPNLKKFITNGARAESMIPSFPSKTFPNHYTIATGMYPDHHGLVDNSYYDPAKDQVYSIGNRGCVEDGSWYSGTPIWVQAAKAGMVTASFFFVGSEADVQGIRPTYYYRYDSSISNEKRVTQALDWLNMPEKERPHLINLYFSDLDDTGHRQSPNNTEKIGQTLQNLDATLGQLFDGISKTGLPVNVVIVSDHGMSPIAVDNLLAVEQIEDDSRYRTVNNGALAHIYLNPGVDAEAVYQDLKAKEKNFKVYRTEEVPFFETPPTNARWGQFLVVPDSGYYLVGSRVRGLRKVAGTPEIGEHGFDPNRREMHGIFYANGPAFKPGASIASFKNIHVYPMMCRILGLEVPAGVDGKAEVLQEILR